jgi:hypothetical protein
MLRHVRRPFGYQVQRLDPLPRSKRDERADHGPDERLATGPPDSALNHSAADFARGIHATHFNWKIVGHAEKSENPTNCGARLREEIVVKKDVHTARTYRFHEGSKLGSVAPHADVLP